MPPIATNSIWFEDDLKLVIRWFEKQPESVQSEAGSPEEILERCYRRSRRVLEYSGLEEAPKLTNSRVWEVRWDRRAEKKRLEAYLDKFETDVVRLYEPGSQVNVTSSALEDSERESIIIVDQALEELRTQAEEAGLSIPLTNNDFAVFETAYEIYFFTAAKMGNEAREWTEDVASHLFVQRLLGLPFNLFVLSFVPSASNRE